MSHQLISDTYLGLFIAQLQSEGYSVFVVLGALPPPMRDRSMGGVKCWHSMADVMTAPPKKKDKSTTAAKV